MNINKPLLVTVFVALFILMVLDIVFVFPNIVKAILYGGAFIAGVIIYLTYNDFDSLFKKKSDSE